MKQSNTISRVLFGVVATNVIFWVGLTLWLLFFPPLDWSLEDRSYYGSFEEKTNFLPIDMSAPEFNITQDPVLADKYEDGNKLDSPVWYLQLEKSAIGKIIIFCIGGGIAIFFTQLEANRENLNKKQSQLNVTHNTTIQEPQNTVPDRPKRSLESQLISTVLNGIQTMAEKWEI